MSRLTDRLFTIFDFHDLIGLIALHLEHTPQRRGDVEGVVEALAVAHGGIMRVGVRVVNSRPDFAAATSRMRAVMTMMPWPSCG
jgi:hypothetical protein